mgnify:CR=1 FL=1
MKKFNGFITILLVIPFLGGCALFDNLKKDEHQHVNNNNDHKCDECGEVISEHIDANNDHKCDICGDTLTQHVFNANTHACSTCGVVFPTIDSNIDGKCDYCGEEWSSTTKTLFNEKLGELLPYFKTTLDFEEKPDYIEAVISGNAVEDLKSNFLSTGVYSSRTGEYGEHEATYLRKLSSNEDVQINVMILYNEANDITYVDAYTTGTEVSEFPTNKVMEILSGHTTETLIVPDDGTAFIFEKGEEENYCMVTYNGNADAYLAKLVNAGYYIDYSMSEYYLYPAIRALSPGRTLAIQITDKTTEVTIEFMAVVAPNGVAWSDQIKTYMTTLIEEVIPFANADFVLADNAEETLEDNEYFQLESYNIDAFKYAINAMKSDTSWNEEYEEDGNFYTYTKDFGYCQKKVVISVLWSITTISVMKVFPTYTKFPLNQIIFCIGTNYTDTIIEAPGESYYLYYESAHEGVANLTVYGDQQDYIDFMNALETANYTATPSGDGWVIAVGPDETIQMDILDCTDAVTAETNTFYKVEIKIIEPDDVFTEFPTEAFEEEMDDDLDFSTVPMPTANTYVVGYPYGKGEGMSDILITMTGGDKQGYTQAIIEAGFTHYELYDYDNYVCYVNHNLHIVIYIYDLGDNSIYAVEFGIFFNL